MSEPNVLRPCEHCIGIDKNTYADCAFKDTKEDFVLCKDFIARQDTEFVKVVHCKDCADRENSNRLKASELPSHDFGKGQFNKYYQWCYSETRKILDDDDEEKLKRIKSVFDTKIWEV